MVICLERDADLHMAQLMPLPLTVSCFREIQIGFTCLAPAHVGSPGQTGVCVSYILSTITAAVLLKYRKAVYKAEMFNAGSCLQQAVIERVCAR